MEGTLEQGYLGSECSSLNGSVRPSELSRLVIEKEDSPYFGLDLGTEKVGKHDLTEDTIDFKKIDFEKLHA